MKNSFLILGAGKVGRSLALTLKAKNIDLYLWDRNFKKTKEFCEKYKVKALKNLKDYNGNFLIITIKDDELKNIALKILKEIKNKGIAIHTSGIYSEKILDLLSKNGWRVGKLHPIFSFPSKEIIIPNNLLYGIQVEKKAIKEIRNFIKILKGKEIIIPYGMENIYHLSLTIGANFTAFLFLLSLKLFKENFKVKENYLKPLFLQIVENIINEGKEGLTGPAVRKDKKTIKIHKKILKEKYPEFLKIYILLTKEIQNFCCLL